MTEAAPSDIVTDIETLRAQLAAREERVELLQEENRWLKAQLLGRSSEKAPAEQLNPDQAWLFNEAEALAQAAHGAPQSITIRDHKRGKYGRKKLDAALPRVEVVHDLPEAERSAPSTASRFGAWAKRCLSSWITSPSRCA